MSFNIPTLDEVSRELPMIRWIRQRLCGLFRQHDDLMEIEGTHICLVCWNCGRRTAGWDYLD